MSIDNNKPILFADVVLPLPVPHFFTYRIPSEWAEGIQVGARIVVPLGAKKIETGVVWKIHQGRDHKYKIKDALRVLDQDPVVLPMQSSFFEWVSRYYMCTLGDVLKAGLPSGFRVSSTSKIQLHPQFSFDTYSFPFSEEEERIINQLLSPGLHGHIDLAKVLTHRSIYKTIQSLLTKEVILIFEEIKEKYSPKKEKRIRLCSKYLDKKNLKILFSQLARKPKQEALVLKYLDDVSILSNPEKNQEGLSKVAWLKKIRSSYPFLSLLKKQVFEEFSVVVPRFPRVASPIAEHDIQLSENQKKVRDHILETFQTTSVVVLEGVTGSGKTEVYIDFIKRALSSGSQVLYILPEIALSTQIVSRLYKIFNTDMGVYHSRFSNNERVETYESLRQGEINFIIGVRSSLFLPFSHLGLIIVDEEHDASYKQQDVAPRYHARDAALMLGQIHQAKVILGSATPSSGSYFHGKTKKMGWASLTERYGGGALPKIELIDMKAERKKKKLKGQFSARLLEAMADTIKNNHQVILFHNRRGYAPITECTHCGWIPVCLHCSVSLTYHAYRKKLVCHYCGYQTHVPSQCPECTSPIIHISGYGTERIVDELQTHFPDARIHRMDLETTRQKDNYQTILQNIETGHTQILVGTQMITKGFDFDKVQLVGVFDADHIMRFPHFRSYERAFQLFSQVSGRSGRRKQEGLVLVQTSSPDHILFRYLVNHDTAGFMHHELTDRKKYFYPPYSRLLGITIKHKDPKVCLLAADQLAHDLRSHVAGGRVEGPADPLVSKVKDFYLKQVLVKIPRSKSRLHEVKRNIVNSMESTIRKDVFKQVRMVIDVDPL